MKIYTRTGDDGETSFLDGGRVPKSALRVATYGEVDELNATLGVALSEVTSRELQELLCQVQKDLFAVGAILADPKGQLKSEKASLQATDVEGLEKHIDRLDGQLPPLTQFLLPGGSKGSALLHQARAVCRRAERKMVALASNERVPPVALAYVNRLSDLLFVMARMENHRRNVEESVW